MKEDRSLKNQIELENYFSEILNYYLQEYIETRKIKDVYSIPDQQFTAALMYIYNHTFKLDNSILKIDGTRINEYDLFKVRILLDKYIFLCFDYNQKITLLGFCTLSGISQETIYKWKSNNKRSIIYIDKNYNIYDSSVLVKESSNNVSIKSVTYSAIELYNTLMQYSELSLYDRLTDKKRNAMTTLPAWNAFQDKKARRVSNNTYNSADIALQLGISDQLQLLPGD